MQSVVATVWIGGAVCLCAATVTHPAREHHVPGHVVVMHLEPFTKQPVTVHIKATPPGVQLTRDTAFTSTLTVTAPADIRIAATVLDLELWTDNNLAVRVDFTDGASDVERRLRPWGRVLSFKRVEGNLQPSPKVLPVEPARQPQ